MRRKYILIFFISLPILVPLVSYLIWKFKSNKPLKVLVYDMTVPYTTYDEHKSFSWVLINQKYTLFNQLNQPAVDYKGFFPMNNFKFVTKDFMKLTKEEVIQLADSLDMAYYTDTYGIYSNEWYGDTLINERSKKVYGGLNKNDMVLLHRMQDSGKLLLAEFNFLASPTPSFVRKEAEKMLDITWTGWVGRYYDSLDSLANPDIPNWAKRLYKKQYHKAWDFHEAGILFVHENDRIVVLEMNTTLNEEVPWVYTSEYGQEKYGLPKETTYPYWFDIMKSGESNRVVSKYKIYTNDNGKKMLHTYGIPDVFPCVIENREKNYYYFCGDFCDNPIYLESAKFAGVGFFHKFMFGNYNYNDRTPFFWNFFRPMVTNILEAYFHQLKNPNFSTDQLTKTNGVIQNQMVDSSLLEKKIATSKVEVAVSKANPKEQSKITLTAVYPAPDLRYEIIPDILKIISYAPDQVISTVVPFAPLRQIQKTDVKTAMVSNQQPSKATYHVIGGSFKKKDNAQNLVTRFCQLSYKAQIFDAPNEFFRVSVDSYQTSLQAETVRKMLIEKDPKTRYWILKKTFVDQMKTKYL